MKLPKLLPQKKLKATARRAQPKVVEEYEEEEPNMRLSSAFMVVMLLHVTAIGGIYAFNNIKDHRAARFETAAKPAEVTAGATVSPAALANGDQPSAQQTLPAQAAPAASTPTKKLTAERGQTAAVTKAAEATPAVREGNSLPEKAEPESHPRVQDSGVVYTTVKGDNPVTIAHHFGVSYDELLKLNNIENPKKLQIGQKLRIPAKAKN